MENEKKKYDVTLEDLVHAHEEVYQLLGNEKLSRWQRWYERIHRWGFRTMRRKERARDESGTG